MRERFCYNCEKKLDFSSLICKNFHLSFDYLKSLWKNKSIQFLCCECFKEEKYREKGITYRPECNHICINHLQKIKQERGISND
jgi:hypothetical protein